VFEVPALIEIIDEFLPAELHTEACAVCTAPRWRFGHVSRDHDNDATPFWDLGLVGDPVFATVWEKTRERCEAIAGGPLRVRMQYATGHTYGLGGQTHFDDTRPGCFTLLYYAVPEWKDGWDGETIFYNAGGDVIRAVTPRPNRAVLFDSRILHAARAPSRACPALRITVAFKLEPATAS
jgi:SM-20-related protein